MGFSFLVTLIAAAGATGLQMNQMEGPNNTQLVAQRDVANGSNRIYLMWSLYFGSIAICASCFILVVLMSYLRGGLITQVDKWFYENSISTYLDESDHISIPMMLTVAVGTSALIYLRHPVHGTLPHTKLGFNVMVLLLNVFMLYNFYGFVTVTNEVAGKRETWHPVDMNTHDDHTQRFLGAFILYELVHTILTLLNKQWDIGAAALALNILTATMYCKWKKRTSAAGNLFEWLTVFSMWGYNLVLPWSMQRELEESK